MVITRKLFPTIVIVKRATCLLLHGETLHTQVPAGHMVHGKARVSEGVACCCECTTANGSSHRRAGQAALVVEATTPPRLPRARRPELSCSPASGPMTNPHGRPLRAAQELHDAAACTSA